ncbi:hypothetical protein PPERSA_04106 [Pseudocohnilembus persalinus]|uniref:EF-hand domain-containing protein n=1 Tax=Pseudocohnilembus persalinus TaxID=266149 RepID=A0A0V0QL81_PSEPJ|nr:hypothetical protein PPERSA_04106 [Pseudocohnilembus persalinus]|eukprot:KRX02903.1 hypothetical protein PPERSA_04106 [Pseudocohnilembus persalinus]
MNKLIFIVLLTRNLRLALGVQHQSLSQAKQACVCVNWPGPHLANGSPNCTEWGYEDNWTDIILSYDTNNDGLINLQEYYPLSVDACAHECGYYDQDAADKIDAWFYSICERDMNDGHGYDGFSYTDLNLDGINILYILFIQLNIIQKYK